MRWEVRFYMHTRLYIIYIYYMKFILLDVYQCMYIYILFVVAICKSIEFMGWMHVCVHFRHHYYQLFWIFSIIEKNHFPTPIRAHLIASDDTLTSLKTLVTKRFSLSKSQNVMSSLWEMTPTAHCVLIQQMVSLSTQLVKFCGWLLAICAFASLVLNRSTWNFGICFSFYGGKLIFIYTII